MMMNHRYILFTGLMVTALCIHAQDIELQTKEKYEYADATQLWRRTPVSYTHLTLPTN